MSGWWQHLPENIEPIAFSLGIFSIRWYAICFVLGGVTVWFWFVANRKKYSWKASEKQLDDLFFLVLIGSFFGARLGYVFWYAPGYFFLHPMQVFWPLNPMTGNFIGIAGLSFHGALLGAAAAIFWRVRTWQEPFLVWTDRFVRILPIGILFGRLGNFLNGELWGRNTDMVWGMSFPQAGTGLLRHPSQLYEMLGEGILLYLFLRWVGRKEYRPGILTACFLFGYGVIRFILEYWREPDIHIGLIGGIFSLGQVLSLCLIGGGGVWVFWVSRKKEKNML